MIVYHESFEAEIFCSFQVFTRSQNFLYENSRWLCSNMDLRESMWDSAKVFYEDLCVQLAEKHFCHEIFMVYGRNCIFRSIVIVIHSYITYVSVASTCICVFASYM